MKKKVILFLVAIMTMATAMSQNYDFSTEAPNGQTLYYSINNSTTVTLVHPSFDVTIPYDGYSKPTGDLIIPDSITFNGTKYMVSVIGRYAFSGCSELTSVSIPSGVSIIEERAFKYCTGITSITIPGNVTNIYVCAFDSCSNLNSIILEEGITGIRGQVFRKCTSLRSIAIPSSVSSFGGADFAGCTSLDSVFLLSEIPASITNNYGTSLSINNSTILFVPCGTTNNYLNSWGNYNYSEAWTPYRVLYSVDNFLKGSCIVTYSICGPSATLTATPNNGYQFDHWSDGNTDNPRTLTLNKDTTLVAYFAPISESNTSFTINPDGNAIVVEGAGNNIVKLLDATGTVVATSTTTTGTPIRFENLTSGTYFVKVGIIPIRLRVDVE